MSVHHVEFTEALEVLEALQAMAVVLPRTGERPLLWKSTLGSLHAAVRGVLILSLSDKNGIGALDERSTQQVLEWLASTEGQRQSFPPVRRYAAFLELLQRAQRSVFPRNAIPLTLWPSQRRDLERLDREVELFRSRFAPSPFTVDVSGMAQVIETGLAVLDQLMGVGSWARRSLAPEHHEALDLTLAAIRQSLEPAEARPTPEAQAKAPESESTDLDPIG